MILLILYVVLINWARSGILEECSSKSIEERRVCLQVIFEDLPRKLREKNEIILRLFEVQLT